MFGPWLEVFAWMKTLAPSFSGVGRPHLNFITLHYLYIISLTLIGSVILYGKKNMDYIDALFFASGSSTQSGLNTINVCDLFLYQQITIYFLACVSTPIFINTFVVFVRLYWFEKRFQNVVMEAQRFRRTRSKARPTRPTKEDNDPAFEEKGVGNRKIFVMHPGPKTLKAASQLARQEPARIDNNRSLGDSMKRRNDNDDRSSSSSAEAEGSSSSTRGPVHPFEREITFADEIRPSRVPTDQTDRLPTSRAADQHIAFLENQRNPKDKSVLYIPGPRDWDRGDVPQQLVDEIDSVESPKYTNPMRGRFRDRQLYRARSLDPPATRGTVRKDSSTEPPNNPRKTHSWLASLGRKDADESGKATEKTNLRRAPSRLSRFATFASGNNDVDLMPYLSYQATVGRNSAFVNLTEAQREELGGIEYRALKTLVVVLCAYFFGFHLLGVVTLLPWFVRSGTYGPSAEANGFSRVWWGFFTPASMFNDLGYTLNPDSMVHFQRAVLPLLLGSFLIVIGNTGFPCMLRFVIWTLSKLAPRSSAVWEELCFLLDHPRRCFTLLFPSKATWWLFWVLVILNSLDLLFFIVLDLNDPVVTSLPPGIRVLNGWFQSASTRTAGFADVDLAGLHPAIQVSYLVMMYISVLPIAISVRRTNVYEERSLGVYGVDDEEDNGNQQSYVGAHLRRQLSFDLWYVFLGLFIIAIVEGDRLQNTNEFAFTLFSVLFEVVSAYGTVGLSLGYPNIDPSFSAEFRTISKLVIIAMQIRGRHRGLPYALDKAILLPSEGLQKKEQDDALRRRRASTLSLASEGLPEAAQGAHNALEKESSGRSNGTHKRTPKDTWSRVLLQVLSAGPATKTSID